MVASQQWLGGNAQVHAEQVREIEAACALSRRSLWLNTTKCMLLGVQGLSLEPE
jgi:hypothetical protein